MELKRGKKGMKITGYDENCYFDNDNTEFIITSDVDKDCSRTWFWQYWFLDPVKMNKTFHTHIICDEEDDKPSIKIIWKSPYTRFKIKHNGQDIGFWITSPPLRALEYTIILMIALFSLSLGFLSDYKFIWSFFLFMTICTFVIRLQVIFNPHERKNYIIPEGTRLVKITNNGKIINTE